jgi:GGDEF domain-containing protein
MLSVSVGVAVYPEDGTTIETLFHAADRALYAMKQMRRQEKTL